jgi:hypothetical protein
VPDVTQQHRAKFIVESARTVRESGGDEWLIGLRQLPYEEVRDKLLQLMGVGRKVADCVALFSLDKTDAVPVDTHVWDITQSLYAQHLQKTTKSLTPKMYDDIRSVWRATFGSHSGWAQAILFAGELTRYRQLLQDNGCAPALGVAIKVERKEAAGSPSKSPLKQKGAKNTPTPSPSSKKPPAAKREPRIDGSVANAKGNAVEGSDGDVVAQDVSRSKTLAGHVRLKLELDAYPHAASDEAAALVGARPAKKVKRERA